MDDLSSLRSLADRSRSILFLLGVVVKILVERDSDSICSRDELLEDGDGRKDARSDDLSCLRGSWSEERSEGSSYVLRIDVDFLRTRSSSELFEESRHEPDWKVDSSMVPRMLSSRRIRVQIRLILETPYRREGVSIDDTRTDHADDLLSDVRRGRESDPRREKP